MNMNDIPRAIDLRAALDTALKAGNMEAARRIQQQLDNEANERRGQRDRRIAARRFTGGSPTGFGSL